MSHKKTVFYEDELTKAQKRLVRMFPKQYKIEKSPEQKEEKKQKKKQKKNKKLLKDIYSNDYNENERYFNEATRYRHHVNAIKNTHYYKDPLKRLMRVSKESEIEANIMEEIQKNQGFEPDPLFNVERYRRRPGGMALLKQIEMELQSRLVDDNKDYKDNIILKKYKKRRKKNKKKKKKDLESILKLDED